MHVALASRRIDLAGISVLAALLLLAYAFKTSPISFMDPGFPILSDTDWDYWYAISPRRQYTPHRTLAGNDPGAVAYFSWFNPIDHSSQQLAANAPAQTSPTYTGKQLVIRFSNSQAAADFLQRLYEVYLDDLDSDVQLTTDLAGLDFSGSADAYYLWCEQVPGKDESELPDETIASCYYWAVYENFFSRIDLYVSPVGADQPFSMALLSDVLNRADAKLTRAAH